MNTNPEEFKKFHEFVKDYDPYYMVIPPRSKIRNKTFKRESFEVCLSMLERGYNVAILAGDNNPLLFIDIDHPEHMTAYKHTLTCVSGSRRGYHLIYVSSDPKVRFNMNNEIGDLHTSRKYIICPGSFVPKDDIGDYYISDFRPPAQITYDELPVAFQKPEEEIVIETTRKNLSPLNGLKIEDVFGISNGKIENPFHDSISKNNTTISNGVLHCWRHDVFHTPISALAVLSGQIECSDGYQHNGDGQLRKQINMDQLFVWSIVNNYLKEE